MRYKLNFKGFSDTREMLFGKESDMDKKGFKVPNFITDKFDLPLYEEAEDEYYTVEEFKREVEKRITGLASLGPACAISPNMITKYIIKDTTDITAGTKAVAEHEYLFVIAKQAARKKNERFLDTIIYHELCHILQIEFLLSNGMLFYSENGVLTGNIENKMQVYKWYLADGYHTELWYAYVDKVNSAFAIDPPVDKLLSDKDLTDIFLESTFRSDDLDLPTDLFFSYVPAKVAVYLKEQTAIKNRQDQE